MQDFGRMATPTQGAFEVFAETLLQGLAAKGIDVASYYMDHACFRVESMDQYDAVKQDLQGRAELLVESMIGGRPIATYKLHEPLHVRDRKVWLIELPSPKKTSPYRTGFEHVEFVMSEAFDDFVRRHPHIEFDLDAVHKPINADVRVALDEHTSAKFHHQSLEDVIALEKATGQA